MKTYFQNRVFLVFSLIFLLVIGDSQNGFSKNHFFNKKQSNLILAQADITNENSDEINIEEELSNLDDDLDDVDQEEIDEFAEDLESDLEGELEEESADLSEEELIDQEIGEQEQDELLLEEEFEAQTDESSDEILDPVEQESPPETISEDEGLAEAEESEDLIQSPVTIGQPIEVTSVDFLHAQNGGTIIIRTTGTPPTPFVRQSEDGRQIIVELSNTRIPDQFKRPYNTREFPSNIGFFQAYQEDQSRIARFVVQIREPIEPLVRLEGSAVLIEAQGPGLTQELAEAEESPAIEDVSSPTDTDIVVESGSPTEEGASPPLNAESSEDLLSDNIQFTGSPISIEVNEANIRNVLEFIANDSGLNLILSDAVTGNVSLKLREIPWDQAFLVVLQMKKLGYIRNGNILMVDSAEAIRDEIKSKKEFLDSKKALEPLQIQIIPISYAKATEITNQIQLFKSDRGQIQSDQRTNSLIITDISENIERMKKLIRTLDVQVPQVLIEGKIIEANENFDQRFGLALIGANLGATITNFTAPSNTDGAYTLSFDLSQIVGLNPGALTGIFDMLENEDVVRVLSSPRVVTLNNNPASINQTEQIPISQSNATAGAISSGTEYKNLTFSLQVTPQVTSGEGIILEINIQREFAGAPAAEGASPPVFGRSANTTVLVQNGDTAVIGGMYQTENTHNFQGIPILKHIPLLGALFRKNFYTTSKTELLIFLTPRVLNRNEAFALNRNNFEEDDFQMLEEGLDEVELEQEFDNL